MNNASVLLFVFAGLLSASLYNFLPYSGSWNLISSFQHNLSQPIYPAFITADLLDLVEISEVEGICYMCTDKHLADFPAELNLRGLILESFNYHDQKFRHFFIPFLVAEYLIPMWRRDGTVSSDDRQFITAISRVNSPAFARYMQNLIGAVYLITGRIVTRGCRLIPNLRKLLCRNLLFTWNQLFLLKPSSRNYASYIPDSLVNIIRVAHQWGLNVGKIVAKFPQDPAVLEYLQSPSGFVDDAVTAKTVIRSMSGPSGFKHVVSKKPRKLQPKKLATGNSLPPQPTFPSSKNANSTGNSIKDAREPSDRPAKRPRIESPSSSPVQQNYSSLNRNTPNIPPTQSISSNNNVSNWIQSPSKNDVNSINPVQPAPVVALKDVYNANNTTVFRRRLISKVYLDFFTIYDENFMPDDKTDETTPFLEENLFGIPPFGSLKY